MPAQDDQINATPVEVHSEKKSKQKIALGAILGYVQFFLNIAAGLVFVPWIIKSVGDSGYGLYTLSNTLVSLFLIDFGLGAAANTFLAKYRADNDLEGEQRFIALITKIFLVLDAILLAIFVTVYVLIDFIYVGLTPQERIDFKVVFLITAGFSLISFPATVFDGVLSAHEEFAWAKIINIIRRLLYIGSTVAAILLKWGLFGLVIANCASTLIGTLLKFFFIKFKLRLKADYHWKPPKGFLKKILFFSGWATVTSIAGRLVFNITPSILGIVSDSTNIAVFGVIQTIEGYVFTFASIMGGMFMPKIGRLLKEKDGQDKVNKLAVRVGRLQLFVLGLAIIGFATCGKEFIELWVSRTTKGDPATYAPAYLGTLIIILYNFVYVPQTVFYYEMFLTERVRDLAISSLIKAAVNLGLCFLLGHFFGAFGAAVSIALSRVLELILLNIFYKKDLNAPLTSFFRQVFLRALPALFAALGVGLTLHFFLRTGLIVKFIVIATSVTAVYLPIAWFFSIENSDRKSFLGIFKKS